MKITSIDVYASVITNKIPGNAHGLFKIDILRMFDDFNDHHFP